MANVSHERPVSGPGRTLRIRDETADRLMHFPGATFDERLRAALDAAEERTRQQEQPEQ